MTYTTNRLDEALAKLADVDEAIDDLARCEQSPTDNLDAAKNHVGAATALLDALRPEPDPIHPNEKEQSHYANPKP